MPNLLLPNNRIEIPRRAFVSGAVAAGASPLLLSQIPGIAFADTSEQKRAEAQEALRRLDGLQSQLDQASAEYGEALMRQEIARQSMEQVQSRIDEISVQISDVQQRLGARAKSMYRTGSASFLDLLLGATSFKSFTNNWDLLNSMSEDDAALVEESKMLRKEVQKQREEYRKEEEVAAAQAQKAYELQRNAQTLVDEMQHTYDSLTEEAAELLAQEEAAREEAMRREVEQQIQNGTTGEGAGPQADPVPEPTPDPEPSPEPEVERPTDDPYHVTRPLPNTNINDEKEQSVPGELVVERARGEIGKPYVWGACGPDSFDCSGLVSYCLSGNYGSRLGTTYTFYYWTRVFDPQPGDICTSWEHCGIYVGDGRMIHAPNSRKLIQEGSVHTNMIFVRY